MPTKIKKAEPSKEPIKDPVKKFFVEEKTTESNDLTETVENLPVKEEVPSDVETETKSVPDLTEEKTKESTDLKSAEQKDTLPSTNLTSFSLLDSDKKEAEKNNMDENNKEVIQNASESSVSAEPALKSSQDEVNKWIENYDDKEETVKKKGSGFFKTFLIILTILSLAAVIAGGVYYYQNNIAGGDTEEAEVVTEKTENIQPTVEPTQKPEMTEVEYSEYSLQILNGSGIPGEAGKVKDLITDLEFESITTGNASSYDFDKTSISIKEDIPAQVFSDIKDLLGDTYDMETKSETLEDSSDYDVIITVGLQK